MGISTAGGTIEGVAQRAFTPLPLRAAAETVQMVVANPAPWAGMAICMDGYTGSTCSDAHTQTFVPAAILAVTAPAVTNPYPSHTNGTTADTSMAVGGTVGEAGATGAATAVSASTAVAVKDAPAGSNVQGSCGHSVPCSYTEDKLHKADLHLQRFTHADLWLLGIFGNTIHQNDGTHLNSRISIAKDVKWQLLHTGVAACSLQLYNLPNGHWAHRFLKRLTDLWVGVVQHRWKLEQTLVFQVVILNPVCGINWFHNVKPISWGWLDAWDAGRFVALVKEVEEANLDTGGGVGLMRIQCKDTTLLARRYHNMVLGGKVHAAVRMATNRSAGGYSKSGHPIIVVLCEKHPDS